MKYKQTRELVVAPFIILSDVVNIITNDVLSFSNADIFYHLTLTTGLGWFVGGLFWVFISGYYLDIRLEQLTITKEDIDFIYETVSKFKINKDITYKEFDKIIKESIEICANKIFCNKEELEVFILSAACLQYKIMRYGTYGRGLREIRYLENENFDAVKIIEHVKVSN